MSESGVGIRDRPFRFDQELEPALAGDRCRRRAPPAVVPPEWERPPAMAVSRLRSQRDPARPPTAPLMAAVPPGIGRLPQRGSVIGSQGRRCRRAVLVPRPPFNPYVQIFRIRLTDGLQAPRLHVHRRPGRPVPPRRPGGPFPGGLARIPAHAANHAPRTTSLLRPCQPANRLGPHPGVDPAAWPFGCSRPLVGTLTGQRLPPRVGPRSGLDHLVGETEARKTEPEDPHGARAGRGNPAVPHPLDPSKGSRPIRRSVTHSA